MQTTSGIIGKGTRSHDPFREFESLASGDNFSDEFHIFGLEVTAEYIIHYIDREPVHILPIELLPFGHNYQYEWYTWLTSISTGNAAFPPTIDEDVFFDYSRSFILPDWGVDSRKEQLDSLYSYFYVDVLTERASAGSQGTDLWFEAERFPNEGLWSDRTDTEDRDYEGFDTIYLQSTTPSSFAAILAAVDGAQRVQRHPKALIPIENAGTYKLWVRSSNQPDGFDRSFAVRVNGITSTTALGTHGSDGFGWETVGTYNLDKTVAIELLKTTSDFARVDRFLLTSDLSYVPAGIGGADNVILNDGYNGLYAGSVTGNSIPSSVITAKSESQSFAGRPVNNLINESGLSGETHSTDPNTMWMNATSFNTPTEMIRPDYIMLELTSEHRLNFMKLWNFNFSGFENRGARAINIYYNNDVNDPGYLSTNPAAWTPLKSIFPDKATGADNYTPDAVNLEGVNATRLLLEINGEYGGSFTGLSEIQLFGDAL